MRISIERARLLRLIAAQEKWIEQCGRNLSGYRQRYGDHDLTYCYGDGGEAIYDADTAALARYRAQLAAL
jgi:hypothetical protein